MALRYTTELLFHLRESPLCTKPASLPPAEDWMGPPPDNTRTQTKTTADRRSHDNSVLDQTNRRPGVERHVSRNSANPEDIILGPPRTSFASAGGIRNSSAATGTRPFDTDKDSKEPDSRDRFSFRNSRNGDSELGDRFRDSRNSNFRRRGDGDQDTEGWSTVKPRKSFGTEGAERFHGRMGGGDRFTSDRKPRDRDDHDATRDRPRRTFDNYGKDAEADDSLEPRPRNGLSRGKSEPWFKNEPVEKPQMTARERIDRAKSWRDKNQDAEPAPEPRSTGRNYDRRWDRDQRNERDPEWMDEPAADKNERHTEEDFKKFMESMKGQKAAAAAAAADQKPVALNALESAIKAEQPAVASAPVEAGPDKFFMAFASTGGLDSPGDVTQKEATPKPSRAGGGKSSRFTSFFNAPHEDTSVRHQSEPPAPPPGLPIMGGNAIMSAGTPNAEKEAFAVLLQKLQRSNVNEGSTPPAAQLFQKPPHEPSSGGPIQSPGPFQQYGPPEHREDPRIRQQQPMPPQDIPAPRPMLATQQSTSHQDKMLQDLLAQRQHASSQGSGRAEGGPHPQMRNNSNAEFLMNLMRAQPEPVRTEQMLMRMHQQPQPQGQRNASISHLQDREPSFSPSGRESRSMRGPPPGFMEEGFHHEPEGRPQPTQILQRPPPPPGLDQMNPNWMQQGGPMPPQQRNMGPPPGLAGGLGGPGGPGGPVGPGRNHPMGGMFPPGPNFPPGGFPPPESMAGPPPRGMQPPPGFFGGPPPPGFMPPPGMGGPGFQGLGPEGHGYPFDGRGLPPPGAAQAFRRQ